MFVRYFFFTSRRRHTRCALVTGVQTCALPICNDVPKGPVNYISPHWLDLMTHMAAKAQDLGLKVGLHNAPGWSSSGGPWITPAQSMQQIVWTETTVAGGKPLTVKLARPYAKRDYYRDAAEIGRAHV